MNRVGVKCFFPLQVTLKMSFPIMGDEEDLTRKKKSLLDQFNYVVRTYKERFDPEKADLFLQNVLHAVSLSRYDNNSTALMLTYQTLPRLCYFLITYDRH